MLTNPLNLRQKQKLSPKHRCRSLKTLEPFSYTSNPMHQKILLPPHQHASGIWLLSLICTSSCPGASHFHIFLHECDYLKCSTCFSVLLPGKCHGRRSLVGCSPWGRMQGVGHDWATTLSLFTFMHWRRKWQPTPVFLPGESQGRGSLVGCGLWGRSTGSDITEATQQQQQQQQLLVSMLCIVCPQSNSRIN